jgi:hypothetical protein
MLARSLHVPPAPKPRNSRKFCPCLSGYPVQRPFPDSKVEFRIYGNRNQTTARGSVRRAPSPGMFLHLPLRPEKRGPFIAREGLMTLGVEHLARLGAYILPGMPHQLQYTGTISLEILCCCSPVTRKTISDKLQNPAPRHSDRVGILCPNRIIPLQSPAIRCTKKFASSDLRQ